MVSTPSSARSRALARSGVSRMESGTGAEEFSGMRFKGQNRQPAPALLREAAGFADQGLVAAMHAVEIADGDDGALINRRHVVEMAEDAHP